MAVVARLHFPVPEASREALAEALSALGWRMIRAAVRDVIPDRVYAVGVDYAPVMAEIPGHGGGHAFDVANVGGALLRAAHEGGELFEAIADYASRGWSREITCRDVTEARRRPARPGLIEVAPAGLGRWQVNYKGVALPGVFELVDTRPVWVFEPDTPPDNPSAVTALFARGEARTRAEELLAALIGAAEGGKVEVSAMRRKARF